MASSPTLVFEKGQVPTRPNIELYTYWYLLGLNHKEESDAENF